METKLQFVYKAQIMTTTTTVLTVLLCATFACTVGVLIACLVKFFRPRPLPAVHSPPSADPIIKDSSPIVSASRFPKAERLHWYPALGPVQSTAYARPFPNQMGPAWQSIGNFRHPPSSSVFRSVDSRRPMAVKRPEDYLPGGYLAPARRDLPNTVSELLCKSHWSSCSSLTWPCFSIYFAVNFWPISVYMYPLVKNAI